jgi:uncharacterized small protein (DUF1192 family)
MIQGPSTEDRLAWLEDTLVKLEAELIEQQERIDGLMKVVIELGALSEMSDRIARLSAAVSQLVADDVGRRL